MNIFSRLTPLFVFGLLALFILAFSHPMPVHAEAHDVETVELTNQESTEALDEQVRSALLKILTESEQQPGTQLVAESQARVSMGGMHDEANQIANNLTIIQDAGFIGIYQAFREAFALATTPEDSFYELDVLITIFMHLGLGLVLEYIATFFLYRKLFNYAQRQEKTTLLKVKFVFARILIQMLGLAVLAISTYICALFYIKENPYFELALLGFLLAFVKFRFFMLIARSIFSPFDASFRLLKIDDRTASLLYYWSVAFSAITFFVGGMIRDYLVQTDMDPVLISGFQITNSFMLNLLIMIGIWVGRHRITSLFIDPDSDRSELSFSQRFFSQFWPLFVIAWLVIIWSQWLLKILSGELELADEVVTAWVITLTFPFVDRLFNAGLKHFVRYSWLDSLEGNRRAERFQMIVQNGFRIILVSIAVTELLDSRGMSMTPMGAATSDQIIELLIIVTLAYIAWELMHAFVERQLPVEDEDSMASLEGDGGGAGASRAETLLPLLRTTMTVFLVIVFTLSALHAAGVAIAPLLAGAGVVGIAIGFGAQKLVQDILGGIFFLLDDAFRRGEYIELDNLRGTVEKISLRSMQLRHHLGAYQTIPYGEIRTVKNLSRDWITMKLELRLPYDTDIEKVRKIIKKVGQEMLQDEEMGPSFILPLKSQGVMRMEESALIIRMKFTSKPGEQWIIRREAYRRVKDALAAAGIHFAHREVRVLLPEAEASQEGPVPATANNAPVPQAKPAESTGEQAEPGKDPNDLGKLAVAAVTSMLAKEAEELEKKAGDDDSGGDDR